jgi:hypothetical protein
MAFLGSFQDETINNPEQREKTVLAEVNQK